MTVRQVTTEVKSTIQRAGRSSGNGGNSDQPFLPVPQLEVWTADVKTTIPLSGMQGEIYCIVPVVSGNVAWHYWGFPDVVIPGKPITNDMLNFKGLPNEKGIKQQTCLYDCVLM